VFRNMEIFESPCFNTWRFKNLLGLNTKIFESPCFNTRRFKNLHVLKHGGFVRQNCSYFWISVFQYMEIQKSPCIKCINFWILVFQYMEIQKYPCIETWRFKNLCVLYTQIFFLSPITRWNRNRCWKYFRVWIKGLGTTNYEKNRVRKSHATVPLRSGYPTLDLLDFSKSVNVNVNSQLGDTSEKSCLLSTVDWKCC